MEKLELKHLAPYLPYGLRFNNGRDYEKDYLLGIRANGYNVPMAQGSRDSDYFRFEKIKPILRPLSDLTKEIKHNGEKFVPLEKIQELFELPEDKFFLLSDVVNSLSDFFFTKDLTDVLRFKTVIDIHQKLLEWHFDVFGLIDKGLAVDVNIL